MNPPKGGPTRIAKDRLRKQQSSHRSIYLEHPTLIHPMPFPSLCHVLHHRYIVRPAYPNLEMNSVPWSPSQCSSLPDTLEHADPIPCSARATKRRPKLLLKAKANREKVRVRVTGRSIRLTQRRQKHDDKARKHRNTVTNAREEERRSYKLGAFDLHTDLSMVQ